MEAISHDRPMSRGAGLESIGRDGRAAFRAFASAGPKVVTAALAETAVLAAAAAHHAEHGTDWKNAGEESEKPERQGERINGLKAPVEWRRLARWSQSLKGNSEASEWAIGVEIKDMTVIPHQLEVLEATTPTMIPHSRIKSSRTIRSRRLLPEGPHYDRSEIQGRVKCANIHGTFETISSEGREVDRVTAPVSCSDPQSDPTSCGDS